MRKKSTFLATRAQMRLMKEFTKPFSIAIPRNRNLDAALIVCPKRLIARRTTVSYEQSVAKPNTSSKTTKKSTKKAAPFTLVGRRRKSVCFATHDISNGKTRRTIRPIGETSRNSDDLILDNMSLFEKDPSPAREVSTDNHHSVAEQANFRGENVLDIPLNSNECIPFTNAVQKMGPVVSYSRPIMKVKRPVPGLLKITDVKAMQSTSMSGGFNPRAKPFVTSQYLLECLTSYELLAKPPNNPSLYKDPIDRQSSDFGKLYYTRDSE